MNNKTVLGSYPGPVNGWFSDKKKEADHKFRTVFYTPTRGAFLALVRLNVFGLADLLNLPNDPRMSAAKKASAKGLIDAFYTKWYEKFGGNRTALAEVIAKGAKERAFGFNIPLVKNLDFIKKLKAAGAIGGFNNKQIGIGDPATGAVVAGDVAASYPLLEVVGTILASLATIFMGIVTLKTSNNSAPGTGSGTGSGTDSADDLAKRNTGPQPTEDTAGYGLIGAAVLAALYFGTQSKTPTRRRTTIKK
jgi:hypothetical protein